MTLPDELVLVAEFLMAGALDGEPVGFNGQARRVGLFAIARELGSLPDQWWR